MTGLPHPPFWLVIIAFLCALGPLVFFHELGHYLVARLFGISAETFSIGFGNELIGWTDRRGTRWKISWLPLGGYVKFVGDMTPASEPGDVDDIPEDLRDRAFQLRPVWQRFLVVLAGPMANFLLAILIFTAFFSLVGSPISNVVGEVVPNMPAAAAGISPGDRIVSIAGRATPTFSDIANVVALRAGETVSIDVKRGNSLRKLRVTLGSDVVEDPAGQRFRRGFLGIGPAPEIGEPVKLVNALPMAVSATGRLIRSIVDGIGALVRGQVSPKQIGGPVKIAQIAGAAAEEGPLAFVGLVALLSINLGFINLLPVPMLDGGHLFFYIVEALRRRPLSERALEWAFRGGLAIILTLLVFTTGNNLGLWDRLQRLIG